jgi:uncharacterized membrane protein YphA (DoxX/SURF4 family)
MQKLISFCKFYAPSILRYGMAIVILWFGTEQLMHPELWTAYIPDSIVSMAHMSALTLVHVNAAFELIFGVLLLFGIQTRIVALLLALHLFNIMWTVGYGEIAVRDFGLAVATLVVSMNGPDVLCMQGKNKL